MSGSFSCVRHWWFNVVFNYHCSITVSVFVGGGFLFWNSTSTSVICEQIAGWTTATGILPVFMLCTIEMPSVQVFSTQVPEYLVVESNYGWLWWGRSIWFPQKNGKRRGLNFSCWCYWTNAVCKLPRPPLGTGVTFWYTPIFQCPLIRGIRQWSIYLCVPQGCAIYCLACTVQLVGWRMQEWRKCLHLDSEVMEYHASKNVIPVQFSCTPLRIGNWILNHRRSRSQIIVIYS